MDNITNSKLELTLTPKLDMANNAASDPAELQKTANELEESRLTPEEQQMVDDFAKQIDLTDTAVVLQYGAGTQQKMAAFSENALKAVNTKDLGEVGNMLTSVVKELKAFDANEDSDRGFFGKLFKKSEDKIDVLRGKYAKAENNVNVIIESLEAHQVQLLKDISSLDQMYDANLNYYKEITMYILAGKKKLEDYRNNDMAKAFDRAAATGTQEDAQTANDMKEIANRFEKKLHDLELTRMISIQTAPQIRLIQNNNTMMAEKIQSTLVNTIPLWKNQMVIALGIAHSAQAANAQAVVNEMTNELLKKNAEALHQATIETAKQSERGIVDIETLQATNDQLINTLDEVLTIQSEGRQKRQQAEHELQNIEEQLKKKLLEIRG